MSTIFCIILNDSRYDGCLAMYGEGQNTDTTLGIAAKIARSAIRQYEGRDDLRKFLPLLVGAAYANRCNNVFFSSKKPESKIPLLILDTHRRTAEVAISEKAESICHVLPFGDFIRNVPLISPKEKSDG